MGGGRKKDTELDNKLAQIVGALRATSELARLLPERRRRHIDKELAEAISRLELLLSVDQKLRAEIAEPAAQVQSRDPEEKGPVQPVAATAVVSELRVRKRAAEPLLPPHLESRSWRHYILRRVESTPRP